MEPDASRLARTVAAALTAAVGGPVRVGPPVPVADGWSARHGAYPWINRHVVTGPVGWGVRSVVVKARRPRGGRPGNDLGRERAALTLLADLDCAVGPRLLAHDQRRGFLVLEDLGAGPALEDLLVGADPESATAGFVALAEAVGRLHAATREHRGRFEARLTAAGCPPDPGRVVTLADVPLATWWSRLVGLSGHLDLLPDPVGAGREVTQVVDVLGAAGPFVALSTGDFAPQNCRIGRGRARLLDFEAARYQHVLLDAAHLRLPFYGGPCWSRIPARVGTRVEAAYRDALAAGGGCRLDDATWQTGMAHSTAAWALVRLVRLPALLAGDQPHPMGFSRRGQLLDTLQVAVDTATAGQALPELSEWFTGTIARLRRCWPGQPPTQQLYPAYR
ncbi:hypothetical protein [Micromonospora sp. RTP1Z1]|uniref:phosphotransferase family protein n=1 Tax=Micromonospora sp. RTP1Z1 TaxID=2994043 RepID=UPI0029C9558B|nr:hypothetical protein [Micromonospora sp. RTP1Z1]